MKKGMKKITWTVIIVLVGLLSLTAITAASDIVWPWSELEMAPLKITDNGATSNRIDEGGTGIGEPTEQILVGVSSDDGGEIAAQTVAKVAEIQPDDIGFSGPISEAIPGDMPPTETDQVEAMDLNALIPEGAPDQVDPNADPNWTTFYYYHVTGTGLRPRESSVNWASGRPGCLYLVSGATSVVFNIHMDVPNGARVDYLRLFFYDTSASDSMSWVTRYDDTGGISDITSVSSSGSTGYGTMLSPLLEHIVDSVNYSYLLNWRPNVIGSTMQLCGLRVAYRLP